MRIVTPVSAFDQHLAPKWCEVIKHLDCSRNHELHLVFPISAEMAAKAIYDELRDSFDIVKMHTMSSEPIGGWPFGPNTQFYACAQYAAKDNPRLPWFLCELDCYPTRSNSFDMLASRYASAGVPFFGKINPTFWRDDKGRISTSLFGKDDTTMSGCAVYPGDLINRRFTAPLMADLVKGFDDSNGAPATGWDVHLRFAIKREGVSDAGNLIADNWNTINYRLENGKLACDNNADHEIYRQNPHFEMRKTNKPVSLDALFIHGCKDGSLPDLILNDELPLEAVSPRQTAATQAVNQLNQPSVETQNEIAELRKMMLEQQKLIASLLQQRAAPEPVKPIVEIPAEPTQPQPEYVNDIEKSIEVRAVNPAEPLSQDAVFDLVKNAGKALTSKTIAAHFNATPEEIQDFVAKTPGLKLSGPPVNWVSLAE